MNPNGSLAHIPIADCMSIFLITLSPYDTIAKAFELMSTNHIRRLPVLENDALIGIVTWSDILKMSQPDPAGRKDSSATFDDLARLTITTVMTRNPLTVQPQQPVGFAAELMLDNKIGGLPVLDADQTLVGLLTESNIFRLIAKRWRDDNEVFSGARRG
jgi:acetoin utilization protein AcuB